MCQPDREMEFDTTEHTAGMERAPKSALKAAAFFVVAAAIVKVMAGPSLATLTGITPEMVAGLLSPLIAEAVPREFEGKKDWGKTKAVTTGLHSDGNFFKFDIRREKKEVNDGV